MAADLSKQYFIKQALTDSYIVAREHVKNNWMRLKAEKKHVSACRVLVRMFDMAKNPNDYYEKGVNLWHKKVMDYVAKYTIVYDIKDITEVYRIIGGPEYTIIGDDIYNVVSDNKNDVFYHTYAKLWKEIINWQQGGVFIFEQYECEKEIKQLGKRIQCMKTNNWFCKLLKMR